MRIGQSVFHDDGAGTYNPAPYALDEATVNEWPGREVGVFISLGTGKRHKNSEHNQHVWYEGLMGGEFAEARRKLIAKVEGCEVIHERMKKELLLKRHVNIENYYRFNVEIGVGEFSMNEWNRLGDISTGTRRYLTRDDEQKMVQGSSTKLAKIHRAKQRFDRLDNTPHITATAASNMGSIEMPLAVELPGDIPSGFPPRNTRPPSRQSYESGTDQLPLPSTPSPRSSAERFNSPGKRSSPPQAAGRFQTGSPPHDEDPDRLVVNAPTPTQYRHASGSDKIAITSPDEYSRWPPVVIHNQPHRIEPPPLPPKTPLPDSSGAGNRRPTINKSPPPYPLDDVGPPPTVNMARKPNFRGR
ncbi:putative patatin-like phospholipase [Rosellinia necatrix]|uniref:Putative patatin-like phospholipase n=1 Tax=Rosellinia necatrix TaxID=77044 RepID=A0A1S8A961_ROSNE|nr:putative patatin-like phospholipase [Rosellinia necatrix]